MASDDRGWGTTSVALAFLAGAVAGAAAAWMLTTPSGKNARERVKKAAGVAADRVRDAGGDLRTALKRAAEAARDAYDEALAARRD
jgi:gas vesicle protein